MKTFLREIKVRAAFAVLVPWVLSAAPAAAQECLPQARITTLDLVPTIDRREEFVPVTIQGTRKLMLLDTGGAMTEITTETADELHLTRRRGNFKLYNMYGQYSEQFAEGSLEVTPLKADSVALAIAPGTHLFGDDTEIAGVLAPDILKHYDIDVDFGTDKMSLFSPDHCDGKVIYWKPDAIAVVPMRVLQSGHIVVPVLLDGKRVLATLDTGAYRTTLMRATAQSDFHLTLGGPDTPSTGTLNGKLNAETFRHTFSTLAFDGIVVKNPQIEIIPDLLRQPLIDAAAPPTGTRILNPRKVEADATMLIGMNVLRHFHLYIAYREQRLYVTPTQSVPVLPPSAEAPPNNLHMRASR